MSISGMKILHFSTDKTFNYLLRGRKNKDIVSRTEETIEVIRLDYETLLKRETESQF